MPHPLQDRACEIDMLDTYACDARNAQGPATLRRQIHVAPLTLVAVVHGWGATGKLTAATFSAARRPARQWTLHGHYPLLIRRFSALLRRVADLRSRVTTLPVRSGLPLCRAPSRSDTPMWTQPTPTGTAQHCLRTLFFKGISRVAPHVLLCVGLTASIALSRAAALLLASRCPYHARDTLTVGLSPWPRA